VHTYLNYIAGKDVASADGRTFTAFNPTTGAQWGTFALAGVSDVDAAVKAASTAFRDGPWGKLSPTRRGRLLMQWGELIAEHADRIAAIETEQNGKLFAEMRAQARTVKDWLYYFGGLSDKIEGTVIPLDRQTIFNYTLREPLGVVAVITPWNSPTFIAIMSLAPALAAGNSRAWRSRRASRPASSTSSPDSARQAKRSSIIGWSRRSRSPAASARDARLRRARGSAS
jgi:aldehyde dehydrogenase (NAD+)